MSMRTFLSPDGTQWTAWLIRPTSVGRVSGTPEEWLAFQNADGTERRRLFEVPAGWEALPDDRLELLRRMAERVTLKAPRHSTPGGVERID